MATSRADGGDQPVRVIGRYGLVSEIAEGALGELWKARIVSGPEQGRIVSIRRVPKSPRFDSNAIERLTNAGFAAMEVRHPKIAAVLDVVVGDSEIALVSEHVGGSLLQALFRPPSGKKPIVQTDVALRIVLDVLEAILAARDQWSDLFPTVESEDDRLLVKAVHGGLMPDSVLLAAYGEAMLLDVGLAGIAMTMPRILDHADVIAYRAPEQLESGGAVDERTDVFTLGVLLWELLAARPLFAPAMLPRPASTGQAVKTKAFSDAMQVATVRRKVLTASIQRLDSLPLLRGRVTKEFADLVARCLERDPAHRFESLEDLIAAILELGPRAVAGHDAVSRLLASIGAAPVEEREAPEPSSSRTTSNRPTAPPEKVAGAVSISATTRRGSVEVDDDLSGADIQSIPPSADVESLPPSTDVESLPPSGSQRKTSDTPGSSFVESGDVESVPPASSSRGVGLPPATPDLFSPFASALAPPLGSSLSRAEETTSAPVVRPVDDSSGDGASTTSESRGDKNRKIVLVTVAAAGVLALLGIVRVATSGHSHDAERPSASAATSATALPSAEPPPAEPLEQASAAPTQEVGPESAAPPTAAPPPTLAPGRAALPAQSVPAAKRREPVKKKPFRPSGI